MWFEGARPPVGRYKVVVVGNILDEKNLRLLSRSPLGWRTADARSCGDFNGRVILGSNSTAVSTHSRATHHTRLQEYTMRQRAYTSAVVRRVLAN